MNNQENKVEHQPEVKQSELHEPQKVVAIDQVQVPKQSPVHTEVLPSEITVVNKDTIQQIKQQATHQIQNLQSKNAPLLSENKEENIQKQQVKNKIEENEFQNTQMKIATQHQPEIEKTEKQIINVPQHHQQIDKKQEPKKELTSTEICDQLFSNYKQEEHKQIKQRIIAAVNDAVPSRLYINNSTLQKYLINNDQKHSFQDFKVWLTKEQDIQIPQLAKSFSESDSNKEITNHLKKIEEILALVDSNNSTLNIKLGLGDPKGKSSLKFGIELRQKVETKFGILIQVKIKKKAELRQFIDNELKKNYNASNYNFTKLCKISFHESQKSLKIAISSSIFQEHVLNHTISLIQKMFSEELKPVLKVFGDITVKNSLRSDENNLQSKSFVKWIAQGVTTNLKIQGNSKIIQHFTTPFAQLFPIFKVVRSGQIDLKLKHSENVDKLFEKLGISELAEQTPSLYDFLLAIEKQHFDSTAALWVGDILKKSIVFACNVPNERISCDVSINISHLHLHLSLAGDACKQLGDLIIKSNAEQFS